MHFKPFSAILDHVFLGGTPQKKNLENFPDFLPWGGGGPGLGGKIQHFFWKGSLSKDKEIK